MSFYVACECGRAFEVADDHTAPAARCPDCGRDVAVAAPPSPAADGAEPVETVDAQRAGEEPGPQSPPPPFGPHTGPQIHFRGPGQLDLRGTGTGCLVLVILLVAVSVAVPQFGAAVAAVLLGCCALPLLVVGVTFWWRLRQLRRMLDPNRKPPASQPPPAP